MTLTFELQEDALDCVMALQNSRRTYTFSRSINGGYEITTAE